MSWQQLKQGWDQFWFAPTSPAPICLFRIVYGVLLLISSLFLLPQLSTWCGSDAILSKEAIHFYEGFEPRFSLLFLLPNQDIYAYLVWMLLFASGISFTLGYRTRLSALIVFICLVSFHQRIPCIFNSGDTIMRNQAFLLIFSGAGRMYSIDAIMRAKKGSAPKHDNDHGQSNLCSPWAQRLLQLHLAAVYCQSVWAKLYCSEWLDGSAVYYCTRLVELNRFPVPFLFDYYWIMQLFTWGTLLFEFSFFSLIWIKEFRYPLLLVGLLFHLSIEYSMNIFLFEMVMMSTYILFVQPEDIEKAMSRLKDLTVRKIVVSGPQTAAGGISD